MSNCEKSTQSPVVVTECTNKSAGEMERPNTDPPQSSYRNLGQLQGPLAIFWDIENCPVPTDVWPEDLGSNIRMALQEDRVTSGTTITTFSAYGDFSSFPKKLREGCQRTGVKLVDVPNGHKDAADKAIMLDMLLFAMDNRPPSTIMLISGDVDFAPTLHVLNQRGYTVILTIRAAAYTSSALINAGQFVWDWPSLARGKGFQSPFEPSPPPSRAPELSGHSIRYQMNEKIHSVVQADPMVFNEGSGPPSLFECTKSYFNPNAEAGHSGAYLAETSARIHISENQSNFPWLQPSILNGIKTRLVNLLEVSGHMLPVAQIQAEHLKFYGYPLFISDYGARCLIPFLEQMPDTFLIGGKDDNRIVYLPWAIGKKGCTFQTRCHVRQ